MSSSLLRSADQKSVRKSLLVGLIATLAIIAAACGSTASDVATSADSVSEEAGADTTGAAASSDDAAEADSADDSQTMSERMEDYYSPISEAMGQENFSFDEDKMEEQNREVELATRECMLGLGFEYDIVDSSQNAMVSAGGFNEDLTEKEYVETYGFGYSTMFEEQFEMFDAEEMATDPNNERMMAMSEAEGQAYQEALWGKNPFEDAEFDPATGQPLDPETGEPVDMDEFFKDYEPTGCQSEAFEEVYGSNFGPFGPGGGIDEDLQTGIEDLYESIEADSRVVAANDSWSACMTEAGYTFSSKDSIWEVMDEKMQPIQEAMFGTPADMAAQQEEFEAADVESMTEEERIAFFEEMMPSPELDADTQLLLEEIQEFELGAAKADFECSKGVEDAYHEVRIEYEENFVAENQAAFDAAAAGN